jgi:hypothetical protein
MEPFRNHVIQECLCLLNFSDFANAIYKSVVGDQVRGATQLRHFIEH